MVSTRAIYAEPCRVAPLEYTACSAVSYCELLHITPDTDIKGLDFIRSFFFRQNAQKISSCLVTFIC